MTEFATWHATNHLVILKEDDYNNIVDHAFEKPVKFLIRLNGSNYEVIHGKGSNNAGKILGTPSTDLAAQIQAAFTNLGGTFTTPEKVIINCSGILDVAGSLPITLPNYADIQINGYLKLGNGMNKHMFSNEVEPKYLLLHGNGTLDGNKTQNAGAVNLIRLVRNSGSAIHISVKDLTFYQSDDYAIFGYALYLMSIHNVKFYECVGDIDLYATEYPVIQANRSYGCATNYAISLRDCTGFAVNGNCMNYPAAPFYLSGVLGVGYAGEIVGNFGNPSGGAWIVVDPSALSRPTPTIKSNNFVSYTTGAIIPPNSTKATNPFHVASATISPFGTSASPTASTTYQVWGMDLIISSTNSGNNNNAILIYDKVGNQINPTALSTLDAYYLPIGYKINWGAFTGTAPTVVVCGV